MWLNEQRSARQECILQLGKNEAGGVSVQPVPFGGLGGALVGWSSRHPVGKSLKKNWFLGGLFFFSFIGDEEKLGFWGGSSFSSFQLVIWVGGLVVKRRGFQSTNLTGYLTFNRDAEVFGPWKSSLLHRCC